MPPDLSPETWAQIRHAYEHTDQTIHEICAEHGISDGTLRDRMRRWHWTRRRPPIPPEGPPRVPAPPLDAAPPLPAAPAFNAMAGPPDDRPIETRLQSALARVLPAIEATLARLGADATHPREMEGAARALAALTRTLRELNTLLSQHQAPAATHANDPIPEDMDEFRRQLARRMDAFVEARTGKAAASFDPQER